MAGDWWFNPRLWSSLQEWLRAPGSSSESEPKIVLPGSYRQLNDHVYEVCKPPAGKRPSVEIVFFHGLQLEYTSEPHISTWLSRGKNTLWLPWLLEVHADARILTVSYDASRERTRTQGRADMYIICENLITCLTDSDTALGEDGCPVILVGHCLGGLVMKAILVEADSILRKNRNHGQKRIEHIENFLTQVKAILFYATPHHGSQLPNMSRGFRKGPLFKGMAQLDYVTERRNEDFRKLRQAYGWISEGVAENLPVKLRNFKGLIVTEASARCEIEQYYTVVDADHFNVCRPETTLSGNFRCLSDLIVRVLKEDQKTIHSSSEVHPQVVGLEVPLDNIEKLFHRQSVRQRYGIVGIGGIGKTVLAKSLFDRISDRFEYVCFVREVKRLMGGGETTDQLHKIVMEKLTRKGRLVDRNFHWSTLRRKRVLLVLDDVESEFHIRVMTKEDSFSEDSVVIVTSRNKRFLESQGFTIHKVETLGRQDSRKLLCFHAFKSKQVPLDFEEHVSKVVDKCGGLPLALEVAGGFLYNRDKATWDDVCNMLVEVHSIGGSTLEEDRLWSILNRSYRSLGQIEQQMFLDIATCLEGEYTVDVQTMWKFRGWAYVHSGWQNLIDRSLVKLTEPPIYHVHGKLSNDEAMTISMHELLRNLGREIACPRAENTKEHEWVFEVSKANELLNQKKSAVKILKLGEHKSLDMRVLHGLIDLRVLWLSGNQGKKFALPGFAVPQSFAVMLLITYLWKTIVTLYGQLIQSRLFPAQLAYVRVTHVDTLKLQEISKIQALRCLVLEYPAIRQLPRSLCRLRQLEHLEIIDCNTLTAIPTEIGQLQNLRFLLLNRCQPLEVFPQSITDLKALEVVNIVRCPYLMVPLAWLRNLPALKDLNVRTCVVENWYELTIKGGGSDGFLSYLRNIKFKDLHYLKGVIGSGVHVWDEKLRTSSYLCDLGRQHESFKQIQRLKRLEIKFVFGEVWILDLTCFQALEELQIHGEVQSYCFVQTRIKNLPDSIGSLLKLRVLAICNLNFLAILPYALGRLQLLETLTVSHCPRLTHLPESIGQLVALQKLEIASCKTLASLPNTTGKILTLETLIIDQCPSMKFIAESIWQLPALQKLTITECQCLETILNTAWNLQALGDVELDIHSRDSSSTSFLRTFGDRVFQAFPPVPRNTRTVHLGTESTDAGIIGQLPALRCLKINDYSLPHAPGILDGLAKLTIYCKSVVSNLNPVWQLRELEHLRLENCPSDMDLEPLRYLWALKHLDLIRLGIVTLPSCVGHLEALESLIIENCAYLKELPESVGQLAVLEHLEIHGCDDLAELPKSTWQLGALKTLIVCYCRDLVRLPESLHQLRLLEHLEITVCESLVDLPESIGELGALKTLKVRTCSKLAGLPTSLNQLRLLQHLELAWCGRFVKLPESIWPLPNLECLEIEGFETLEALPEFIGQLQRLKVLRMNSCYNLVTLPEFVGQLSALQLVEISLCSKLTSLPKSLGQLARLLIYRCIDLEAWRPTLRQVDRLQQLELTLYSTMKMDEAQRAETTVFYPRDLQKLAEERKSLGEFATTISRADLVF